MQKTKDKREEKKMSRRETGEKKGRGEGGVKTGATVKREIQKVNVIW